MHRRPSPFIAKADFAREREHSASRLTNRGNQCEPKESRTFEPYPSRTSRRYSVARQTERSVDNMGKTDRMHWPTLELVAVELLR
jgi:hypothetical protein